MANPIQTKLIEILGIKLTSGTKESLLHFIRQCVHQEKKTIVLSGNTYSFNLAYENPWLRDFFNQADWVRLDGSGLILGAWIMGYKTAPRITWADFVWDLANFCEKHDMTLFFLGSKPGVAKMAAKRLKERFSRLQVIGTHHGYFEKKSGTTENEKVIQKINAVKPNILIVGFGMPLQEFWIKENWKHLEVNVTLTAGAVFDYVTGNLRRGPKWMTNHGFEWLARLIIEPKRLWKRYVIGNPLFIWRLLRERFQKIF